MNRLMTTTLLLMIGLVAAVPASEKAKESARKILKEHQDAVIWVEAVLKFDFRGSKREQKVETLAVTIDKDGLAVCSLGRLDPFSAMDSFAQFGGSKPKSGLAEVKMVMEDGTEYEAKMILKDPDLDLAFLMPKKKQTEETLPESFSFVTLDPESNAQLLDDVIVLGRLEKSMGRQPSIQIGSVTSIVKKPRKNYNVSGNTKLGTPVFNLDGKVLGLSLMRKSASGGSPALVVLPSEDVLEITEQAIKAKSTADEDDEEDNDKEEASEEVKEETKASE